MKGNHILQSSYGTAKQRAKPAHVVKEYDAASTYLSIIAGGGLLIFYTVSLY